MRIDDLNRAPVTANTEQAQKTDPAGQNRGPQKDALAAGSADQAEVSQLAQALATRDPDRINQLRLDVQSGKYEVSAETVAKALVDAHLKP
jgi:flagellar biosynthesis anti-sigma factor FlgM